MYWDTCNNSLLQHLSLSRYESAFNALLQKCRKFMLKWVVIGQHGLIGHSAQQLVVQEFRNVSELVPIPHLILMVILVMDLPVRPCHVAIPTRFAKVNVLSPAAKVKKNSFKELNKISVLSFFQDYKLLPGSNKPWPNVAFGDPLPPISECCLIPQWVDSTYTYKTCVLNPIGSGM